MNFLVEHPLAEVMIQAEIHMVRQGFKRTLASTEATQSFYQAREGIASVAEAIGLIKRRWVRFLASEEREGRTRLTIAASTPELKREVEQWATKALGATPWPG